MAHAHIEVKLKRSLNAHMTTWLGVGGRITWPLYSPDLSLVDIYSYASKLVVFWSKQSELREIVKLQ
jgi:hypothetical protein